MDALALSPSMNVTSILPSSLGEASESELRERREREEERRAEAAELGAEVEEPLFLPTPAFMASAEEE
jgi:hypothetical protein